MLFAVVRCCLVLALLFFSNNVVGDGEGREGGATGE